MVMLQIKLNATTCKNALTRPWTPFTLVNVFVDLLVFTLLPVPHRPDVVDIGVNTTLSKISDWLPYIFMLVLKVRFGYPKFMLI